MTQLRDELRQGRLAYQSSAYPGDLADDLLPEGPEPAQRKVSGVAWLRVALGGTLAAATALMVVHRNDSPTPVPTPAATAPPLSPQLAQAPKPTPLLYQIPDRLALTFPASPLFPVTPPVTVSLSALNSLGQQQYNQIRQRLSWPGILTPSPKPVEVVPAATQQAV